MLKKEVRVMRKWACLDNITEYNGYQISKVMIYETANDGVYVFLYDSPESQICVAEEWYVSVTEATNAWDSYIRNKHWTEISDPLPNCQDDSIFPIRVKGRDIGKPEWGVYELFLNGSWVAYKE